MDDIQHPRITLDVSHKHVTYQRTNRGSETYTETEFWGGEKHDGGEGVELGGTPSCHYAIVIVFVETYITLSWCVR